MSQYVAPAFLKPLAVRAGEDSSWRLCGRRSIGAQAPILRFGGRGAYVSPQEKMLVTLDTGGVVMIDLARIPQGETRQIAPHDYVTVIGFIRRPSHRVIATSIQWASPWVPTTPAWAPRTLPY